MSAPLVTFGVPVYRGQAILPTTLECLRTQTYPNIEVLISVDAADQASAEACKPFLQRDPRFRMHVHPSRLGWAANTGWTMRERRGDFYLYQQHDDQVSPTYVADLVEAAIRWPSAAICFSEVQITGDVEMLLRDQPLLGDPLGRALIYMRRLSWVPLRGLIRGVALDATAGLLISDFDPFDSFGTEFRFMAELALLGEFRFVEGPTYWKRVHGSNLHLGRKGWSEEKRRLAWACLAAWMIEVIVPVGRSVQERQGLLQAVLDRFLVRRGALHWLRRPYRWLYNNGNPAVRPLRAFVDALRKSGHIDMAVRNEWIQCDVESLEQRASLLRQIFGFVENNGRFSAALLDSTWEELEESAIRSFATMRTPRWSRTIPA